MKRWEKPRKGMKRKNEKQKQQIQMELIYHRQSDSEINRKY